MRSLENNLWWVNMIQVILWLIMEKINFLLGLFSWLNCFTSIFECSRHHHLHTSSATKHTPSTNYKNPIERCLSSRLPTRCSWNDRHIQRHLTLRVRTTTLCRPATRSYPTIIYVAVMATIWWIFNQRDGHWL